MSLGSSNGICVDDKLILRVELTLFGDMEMIVRSTGIPPGLGSPAKRSSIADDLANILFDPSTSDVVICCPEPSVASTCSELHSQGDENGQPHEDTSEPFEPGNNILSGASAQKGDGRADGNFHQAGNLKKGKRKEEECVICPSQKMSAETARIPAHKFVLSLRSPVFRAMLYGGLSETLSREVEIPDFPAEVVRAFLSYLYTDSCDAAVMEQHGELLLAAACKYQVTGLESLCEEHLCATLSVENVVNVLFLADLYEARRLKYRALQFISCHTRAVVLHGIRPQTAQNPHYTPREREYNAEGNIDSTAASYVLGLTDTKIGEESEESIHGTHNRHDGKCKPTPERRPSSGGSGRSVGGSSRAGSSLFEGLSASLREELMLALVGVNPIHSCGLLPMGCDSGDDSAGESAAAAVGELRSAGKVAGTASRPSVGPAGGYRIEYVHSTSTGASGYGSPEQAGGAALVHQHQSYSSPMSQRNGQQGPRSHPSTVPTSPSQHEHQHLQLPREELGMPTTGAPTPLPPPQVLTFANPNHVSHGHASHSCHPHRGHNSHSHSHHNNPHPHPHPRHARGGSVPATATGTGAAAGLGTGASTADGQEGPVVESSTGGDNAATSFIRQRSPAPLSTL